MNEHMRGKRQILDEESIKGNLGITQNSCTYSLLSFFSNNSDSPICPREKLKANTHK